MSYNERQLGLDEAIFARSNGVLARSLEGGPHLTRVELAAALRSGRRRRRRPDGRPPADARRGRGADLQRPARAASSQSYALLDERVPPAGALDRDAALAELARRYVLGHGPVTLRDFVWWSGLTVGEARRGLEGAGPALVRETVEGADLLARAGRRRRRCRGGPTCCRTTTSTRSRTGTATSTTIRRSARPRPPRRGPFGNVILLGGRVVGAGGAARRGAVDVEARWFDRPSEADRRALAAAAEAYGAFLGRPVELTALDVPGVS